MDEALSVLRQEQASNGTGNTRNSSDASGGIIAVKARDVVAENKNNPMVAFYAAAIGVMFLLFTSSGAASALLDEAESGTLGAGGIKMLVSSYPRCSADLASE